MLTYLLSAGFLLGIAYDLSIEKLHKKYPKNKFIAVKTKNFHIHHSTWGLIIIVFSLILKVDFLLGLALGGIISHSIRSKSLLFFEWKGKRFF